ncbi:response regulator transcription factor [Arcobacter ellisii]|uniref:DNA-binding response regulator n=1 Tax=Arcobacter ellisii TaxID=913109 RepID=A0A347U4X1_9BACT|nr:winged helix-turn-helix domain-containing protein [Arcobacter ellisii]AXX93899.1 signal transduction response regulator, OmpR family [Arcobacter ellisii]RXI33093.1 DNA-binding response regulator [Arcobacter ellisii]
MELSDLSVLHIMDNQDKDEKLYSLLCKTVSKITSSSTISEAKQQYLKQSPCLIIIESEFENRDIIDFLIEIRKDDIKTAFVVLSNNKNNQFLTELLELYITKYIIKPFDNEILLQALNKCMEIIERRIYSNFKLLNNIFFNFQTQSIIKNNESFVLNKKESLLMNLLIQNQGRVITYEELEYHIWNNECTNAALKSLIRDLRKKTNKNIIKNYSGIGYKLELKSI